MELRVEDLRKSYGGAAVLQGVSFTAEIGLTRVTGSSGIGKTTLLRLIGGQISPDKGEILFDGENVPAMSRSRLFTVRKRMSMLFQSGALFTDMNVFDNVAYPLREHTTLPAPLLKSTVMMKLEAVGLRGFEDVPCHTLSAGQQRRDLLGVGERPQGRRVLHWREGRVVHHQHGRPGRLTEPVGDIVDGTAALLTLDGHHPLYDHVSFAERG